MGTLNIVVRKRALSTIQKVAEWYKCEVNNIAAQHFVDDVYNVFLHCRIPRLLDYWMSNILHQKTSIIASFFIQNIV